MKARTFLATAGGLATSFITVFLIESLSLIIFPNENHSKPKNMEEWELLMKSIPVGALLLIALAHGIGVLLGGFVANRIDRTSIIGFLVIFLLMFVSTTSNVLAFPHPLWFQITDISVVIVSGLITWKILKWN